MSGIGITRAGAVLGNLLFQRGYESRVVLVLGQRQPSLCCLYSLRKIAPVCDSNSQNPQQEGIVAIRQSARLPRQFLRFRAVSDSCVR